MTPPSPTPHPGFGAFGKVHREFFDALGPDGWRAIPGYAGVEEKILSGSLDSAARRGAVTRLCRWAPDAAVDHPVSHDWCEEVFVVSGSLMLGTLAAGSEAVRLPFGTYAVRPPHIPHGPFFSDEGCLLIELLYFPPAQQEPSRDHADINAAPMRPSDEGETP